MTRRSSLGGATRTYGQVIDRGKSQWRAHSVRRRPPCRQETVRARERRLPEWGGGDVDATDLDILEGWVGEVELSAHKLAAEISKLRTFIEEVNESEAMGTDTASDDTGSGRKASSRRRSARGS
jgi:hypothetical protein